jgi:deoxyribonuclease V
VAGPRPYEWPADAASLEREQQRIAKLEPAPWEPGDTGRLLAGGCFLAYAAGEQGPGHAGDHAWSAAVILDCDTFITVASAVVPYVVSAAYERGHLALREGPALAAAVDALERAPDVLLVDATGRDHPRGAGLATHLGAALDVPTVGVTHRALVGRGEFPAPEQGATSPLMRDGDVVGAWLRTQRDVRPMAVHAGWRVDVDTAVRVVLACTARARTPEPLRRARAVARTARAKSA